MRINGRENDYCFNNTFLFFSKRLWFLLLFFISTSVQRQGVTDDFLALVPPHPFTHAFSFSLWLFFFLLLPYSVALSLHRHTTNDIIIWAFHRLLALCISYMCPQYCACTIQLSLSLSVDLSFSFLYVYNSNSWVLSLCKHYPESILLRRKRRLALIELIIQQKCKERKINLLISISIAILFFLDKLLVVCVYMHYPSYYS